VHEDELPAADYTDLYPSRSGAVYRRVKPNIGYVDLERLTNDQVDDMFEAFQFNVPTPSFWICAASRGIRK
jgi:hypothetical protein